MESYALIALIVGPLLLLISVFMDGDRVDKKQKDIQTYISDEEQN